jgi:hypothetical protein
VCCNDSTVKVFALPSMSSVTVLRCPCPINYVALSPDGCTLVAVGDCDPTYLYQATPSGEPQLEPRLTAGEGNSWDGHPGFSNAPCRGRSIKRLF